MAATYSCCWKRSLPSAVSWSAAARATRGAYQTFVGHDPGGLCEDAPMKYRGVALVVLGLVLGLWGSCASSRPEGAGIDAADDQTDAADDTTDAADDETDAADTT